MSDGPLDQGGAEVGARTSAFLSSFLQELTSISKQHGLGINEDAELFVMEAEDFCFQYSCNQNGRLERL